MGQRLLIISYVIFLRAPRYFGPLFTNPKWPPGSYRCRYRLVTGGGARDHTGTPETPGRLLRRFVPFGALAAVLPTLGNPCPLLARHAFSAILPRN